MLENCDKCGSKIENGKCSCGIWVEDHEKPQHMKDQEVVLKHFANDCEEKGKMILSMDHHSGACMILFMGDYHDCYVIKDYMERIGIGER